MNDQKEDGDKGKGFSGITCCISLLGVMGRLVFKMATQKVLYVISAISIRRRKIIKEEVYL